VTVRIAQEPTRRGRVAARRLRGVHDARPSAPPLAELRRLELRMKGLCLAARMLPALTAENAASERERLIRCLARGDAPVPNWQILTRRVPAEAFRLLDELRSEAQSVPGAPLYEAKLDELELELLLVDALGKPRFVRPLAARRYGTGAALAPTPAGPVPLARCARMILDCLPPGSEPSELPAIGGRGSLGALVYELAAAAGLPVEVRVEPRLSAGAATGERTVFLAARRFGRTEAQRLAVHEVLGHLLSAANAREQPLGLLTWGTAGSFVDQEGVALYLEERAGLMDAPRLRTLAARVLAADLMHGGASFADTARKLLHDEHFAAPEAVAIAERAYRGGGVARDVGYLLGWLRVTDALERGTATLTELQLGRVSVQALPELRVLEAQGYVRGVLFRPPNFSRSFFSTRSGTTPFKSPPSEAASLIRLELTKK
jgi:hypothetical protein